MLFKVYHTLLLSNITSAVIILYNITLTSYHVIVSTYHMIDECTIIVNVNYTGSQEQVVGNDIYTKEFNNFPLLCKLL